MKRAKTVRVTPDFVNDLRLSPLAVRVFLVLVNCRERETGVSTITIERIAKRVGRSKKNALLAQQELIELGYIRNLAPQRIAGSYEFLSGVENDTHSNYSSNYFSSAYARMVENKNQREDEVLSDPTLEAIA